MALKNIVTGLKSSHDKPVADRPQKTVVKQLSKDHTLPEKKELLKIGDLLKKEGFVTEKDIQQALDIQKWEIAETNIPIGKLLVKRGLLTDEQLNNLLDHPYLRKQIGKLALRNGYITETQLTGCLNQRKSNEHIGESLIKSGFITKEQLKNLLDIQINGIKTGELALKLDLISKDDLESALEFKRSVRTLGEILCDLKLISPLDLNYVLYKYGKQRKLGQYLLANRIVSDINLKKALQEQKHRGELLGKILLEKNMITSHQLYIALSRMYNIPFHDLSGFTYNEDDKFELIRIIGQKYSLKNEIIPLEIDKNSLLVALNNPDNFMIVRELNSIYPNLELRPVLVTEDNFNNFFELLYGKSLREPQAKKSDDSPLNIDRMEINLEEQEDMSAKQSNLYGFSDMEAEEIVNYIIKYGIANGASDIHIEQDQAGMKVRYRIDGVLQELKLKWLDAKLKEMSAGIISRIKVISQLNIAEKRKPQDGVFRISYSDKTANEKVDLDFRVAVCPAIIGENVTIRILDSRKAKVGLNKLGHSEKVLKEFKELLTSSAGMVLVSGPTGSGKSSTLYAALQFIHNPGIKIITAEDPIEYGFQGIMQTQANSKIGLTFAHLLRSFLRLDPDVILVGEMRDSETAQIGFDAAQTGHLLLSTVHTNDAVGAVSRLIDLNIEYSQMASSLLGVIAQRLVRQICPSCKRKYIPEESEWGLLFNRYPSHYGFFQGRGCKKCDHTGYKGRMVISELFSVNKEIAQALYTESGENRIKEMALQHGMRTMVDDGISKLERVTLSELVRVLPHEMIKEFQQRSSPKKSDSKSKSEVESDSEYTIYGAETDATMINMMFKRYQNLNRSAGVTIENNLQSLFGEFIVENYQEICMQNDCSIVAFFIKKINNEVKITASPKR